MGSTTINMFQTFFYQPILNLLIFLYNNIPGNDLGVAIILLTIIVKLLLLPLTKKQLKSQKSLQELQPKLDKIKKDYANQKEEMGKKMMELYKENKVNPLSSCLPLLIQMPFLFAIFRVFRDGFENGTLDLLYPFIQKPETINYIAFGFFDLHQKSLLLAILAGLAQFWQSKMMLSKKPSPKVDGSQDEDMASIINKQMMYFMPVMTVFIAMSFEGGLALYWFVSTMLMVFQQLYIFNKKNKKDNNELIEGELV